MRYGKTDLQAVDIFARFLVFLGGMVWLWAARAYLIDARYLKPAFGLSAPVLFPVPAVLGSLLVVGGFALNFALWRERRKATLPHSPL